MLRLTSCLAVLVVFVGAGEVADTRVNAASTSIGDSWPSSPEVETVDASTVATTTGRRIYGTRKVRQTFRVDTGFVVSDVYLSMKDITADAFTISIFELDNTLASLWSAGNQVGSTIVAIPPTSTSDLTTVRITLNATEQFSLAATSGATGYGLELESIGPVNGGTWVHAWDGTDYYSPGRYYPEYNEGSDLHHDMGLALTAIPEPSTLILLTMGAVGLLAYGWRRRR